MNCCPHQTRTSGIMSWSATKTLCLSSTTSATTWQRRLCGSCHSRSNPGTSPGARRTARRRPRAHGPAKTDLQLCFMTLTPLYYRLRERRMEASRWSKWETHCVECRTNYRRLKRGRGLQRALLLWEIKIWDYCGCGVETRRDCDYGETGASLVPRRREESHRAGRETLRK